METHRRNNSGGHKVYYSGRDDIHSEGVGFLVHKDTISTVMGCRPVSSRLISIRLKATPFDISVVQSYAPTNDYSDEDLDDFYNQLQEIIDETPKKDILVVQGDWNAKVGIDAQAIWKDICGPSCNPTRNERGYQLLKFAATY
ncbi:craniofacial development protein 2-like [Saccostrea cucullata]|uniref:craniofacial development protein 2-like n=1 Tax=Saccostrea cuccullata TaxID=36930 RepID=UPI002ED3D8FE